MKRILPWNVAPLLGFLFVLGCKKEPAPEPNFNGFEEALEHLATQSSVLEKTPGDSRQPVPPGYDPYDPCAACATAYVYGSLTNWCDLLFEPGTRYFYSNTGMLIHLKAQMGLTDTSPDDAMALSQQSHVDKGYMAYMGFDPEAMTGLEILCNQSYEGAIIRFGEDVLQAVNPYDPNH